MSDAEHPMPGQPVSPNPAKKTGNGSTLICTTDPQGFIVTLDVHRWEDHIVKRHPEMGDHLERIRLTIEDPQLIQRSESTTTAYYYRLTGRSGKRTDDIYVSVVVDRNEETKTGVVKTAHLLKSVRTDESRTIWLKRS